ncbi:hypothetical protein N7462_010693 [Penicillium macrosclerotiorum]|uniref:uncharacterized protein n=1 Tax=Penicillium macrosclerotiorum TaxID=303699 RepID=UPI0025494553|nr:uncharacterized protein N7462_010693 [Penicillium macrosclerotiorum]KAJ5669623.1 hypothetical protein N7462_010693 [Penicillium macrosclerotiorum]
MEHVAQKHRFAGIPTQRTDYIITLAATKKSPLYAWLCFIMNPSIVMYLCGDVKKTQNTGVGTTPDNTHTNLHLYHNGAQ